LELLLIIFVFFFKEKMMKQILLLCLSVMLLTLSACTPLTAISPSPSGSAEAVLSEVGPTSSAVPQITPVNSTLSKTYTNSDFGLQFNYPAAWFGPDEYVSDQTLRVAVGSDTVYPYGTDRAEQLYTKSNSYYVVVQYTKDNQNNYWQNDYLALVGLKDGESVSSMRNQLIKVRQLKLGRFTGIEYLSTLSDTAQTEPVYIRQVILFDDQSDLLTLMGTPNNVDLSSGTGWLEAYQKVDAENAALFDEIVASLTIK
jgi:hypothetical protein